MSESRVESSEELPPGTGVAVRGRLFTVIFHASDTPGPGDGTTFRELQRAVYLPPRSTDVDTMTFRFVDAAWTMTNHGESRPPELPDPLYRRALRLIAGTERSMSRRVQGHFAQSNVARRQQMIDPHLDSAMVAVERGSVDDCVVRAFPADSGSSEPLGRVGVMRGRKQIAKLNQNTGVLFVDDEGEREAAIELLARNGYQALPPIGASAARQVTGRLGYIQGEPCYVLDLHFDGKVRRSSEWNGDPGLRAALYLPQNRGLVSLTSRVDEIATEVLERHGLKVELRNTDVGFPSNCRPTTYERLTWKPILIRQAVPKTPRARPFVAPVFANQQRTLSSEAASLLPEEGVANVVRALLEGSPPDYYTPPNSTHIWWLHRTPVLSPQDVDGLLGVAPETQVPREAFAVVQVAASHRSAHAPLLAATMLRTRFPEWWNGLDVGETISGRPDGRLWDLSSQARSQSKHSGLLELLSSRQFPSPDLPKSMRWNAADELRLWIAAAAVLRASLTPHGSRPLDPRDCRVCGRQFLVGGLTLSHVLWLGRDECCPGCADDAYYGSASAWTAEREIAIPDAVRALAREWGGPPPRAGLQLPLSPEPVDAWVASLLYRQLLPNPVDGRRDKAWTARLADAGVLEGYRPSRGVMSTAADGHVCRSMFERHLDDFFTSNGIAHEAEPDYPTDQELNTTGLRGDWRLEDGTFVEAAGMLENPAYALKIARKLQLAERYGFPIIVVEPKDLSRLHDLFGSWMA